MSAKKLTTIALSPETVEALKQLAHKGMTYEQIVRQLIDAKKEVV